MLIVEYEDTYKEKYHFGDDLRELQMLNYNLTCIRVQADGDELETIRQKFSNIPMHNGPVVRWTGDFAKFIIFNLSW